jgi:hypothetical protein
LCKQVSCKKWVGVGVSRNYGVSKMDFFKKLKIHWKKLWSLTRKGLWEKSTLSNLWTIPSEKNLILFYVMTSYCLEMFLDRIQNYFPKILFIYFYISSNIYYIFLETVKWGNLGHFYFISNLTSMMFLVQINYFNYVLETYARILQKMFPPKSLSHY